MGHSASFRAAFRCPAARPTPIRRWRALCSIRFCPPRPLHGEQLEILNIVGTGHLCVCFEAPEQRLAALVPHVALGVEQGEKCIYIANGDGPAAVGALRAAGVDVDAASKRAALLVIERRQTPLADGPFEPARLIDWWRRCADDAAKEGFSKICVAAEMLAAVGPGS